MSKTEVLCLMCDWLIGIDEEGNYYCGLWGVIKPRKVCKTFKNIELFKELIKGKGEGEKPST